MTDFYFGCVDMAGHFLWDTNLRSQGCFHIFCGFDARLAPLNEKGYQARFWFLEDIDYYAVSFWDYTIDKRGKSNSIFFTNKKMEVEEILPYFENLFPTIFERLPEIEPLYSSDGFTTITSDEAKKR